MNLRGTLDLVDVYEHSRKCFNIRDCLDIFVPLEYNENVDCGVYNDQTIHVVLFELSNVRGCKNR